MATYPYSTARLVQPNAPQVSKRDNPRIQAVKRRLAVRRMRNAKNE